MEISLFEKYKKVINKQINEKEKIINIIKDNTGIILNEKQIDLDNNKKITLFIPSTQKNIIKMKKIKEILEKERFFLN